MLINGIDSGEVAERMRCIYQPSSLSTEMTHTRNIVREKRPPEAESILQDFKITKEEDLQLRAAKRKRNSRKHDLPICINSPYNYFAKFTRYWNHLHPRKILQDCFCHLRWHVGAAWQS